MNIKNTEKLLGARHVGSYTPGHTGIQVFRFGRDEFQSGLVVKFAPIGDTQAEEEIAANFYGYNQIRALGGSELVPPELKKVDMAEGEALVMRDLVSSMRKVDGGMDACELLWEHFLRVVQKTAVPAHEGGSVVTPFVEEVTEHIKRFSHEGVPELLELIQKADWTGQWGKRALMLLDFTPDNLFLHEAGLSFIDPWRQGTYLGHPAVSIGQFSSLMRLYHMKDDEKAAHMFEGRCLREMPMILGCDISAVKQAFNLGCTLQHVLSAYVRRELQPLLAAEFIAQAKALIVR